MNSMQDFEDFATQLDSDIPSEHVSTTSRLANVDRT